jgi:hypothetical protein
MNYELNELIENSDIVRFIKSGRIAWLDHVMQTDDKRISKRILEWKSVGTRTRGRPRKRWTVGIEEDMQIMGINVKKRMTIVSSKRCFGVSPRNIPLGLLNIHLIENSGWRQHTCQANK